MRLYLLQTGEALPRQGRGNDFERPLSDKGRMSVEKLASLLSTVNLNATRVIHSGNVRAQQTLELLHWAATTSRIALEARSGLNPEDPVEPWVAEIGTWEEPAVIVGHQPFLGRLVSSLVCGRQEPPAVLFVPGTAVCMEKGEAGWSVAWAIPPSLSSGVGRY